VSSLRITVVLILGLGLATASCSRGPAEEALAHAEETLEGVRAHLERHAPEMLAPLDRARGDARAALTEGRDTDALRLAQGLPARIHRAVEVADRKRTAALATAWDELSRGLPARLGRLRVRIAGLALTPGPDGARLEKARAEVQALGQAWESATTAFDEGDTHRAVTLAREVETRAAALGATLTPPSVGRPEVDASALPR
jgi:hypothetical protein